MQIVEMEGGGGVGVGIQSSDKLFVLSGMNWGGFIHTSYYFCYTTHKPLNFFKYTD